MKTLLEIIDEILLSAIARKVAIVRFVHDVERKELQVWECMDNCPFELHTILAEGLTACIISRLKIMGEMSISDHRTVQRGVYEFHFGTELSKTVKLLGIICLPTIPDGDLARKSSSF